MEKSQKKSRLIKSKYVGVTYRGWAAEIHINGERVHLGTFDTEEEAHMAYVEADRLRSEEYPTIVNLSGEVWADVVGYEGLYCVSNMGRAKTLSFNKTGKERLLKMIDPGNGYCRITLGKKPVSVHRLVWEAFNGPISNGLYINHKNRIKNDNRLVNLEVVTPRENQHHWLKRDNETVGVSPHQSAWAAYITYEGKQVFLGHYKNRSDAQRVFDDVLCGIQEIERVSKYL